MVTGWSWVERDGYVDRVVMGVIDGARSDDQAMEMNRRDER
jgi:hypothetical protein